MRRFSRGDQPHVGRAFRRADRRRSAQASRYVDVQASRYVDVGERRIDERTGGGRIDTGPDNCQEIVSKIRE